MKSLNELIRSSKLKLRPDAKEVGEYFKNKDKDDKLWRASQKAYFTLPPTEAPDTPISISRVLPFIVADNYEAFFDIIGTHNTSNHIPKDAELAAHTFRLSLLKK